jgi:hypothetical protein
MHPTARELADQVIALRRKAWEKSNPSTAIVATDELNPDDRAAVERLVADSGFEGKDREEMVRKVSSLVVGKVEALADDLPADNGD